MVGIFSFFFRYNSFHDQLLLSSGSDSRVVVASLASLSSEPCGHLVEGEEGSRLEDGLIQVSPICPTLLSERLSWGVWGGGERSILKEHVDVDC